MNYDDEDFPMVGVTPDDLTKEKILEYFNRERDAERYRWLKEHMTVVLCEGKTTECYSKYMLPRLMAESRSGEKYTLDEIIDMKMGEISE